MVIDKQNDDTCAKLNKRIVWMLNKNSMKQEETSNTSFDF